MVSFVDFHMFWNVSVTPTNRAEHAHLRTIHLRLVLLYFLTVFVWFWYWASRIVSLTELFKANVNIEDATWRGTLSGGFQGAHKRFKNQ